MTEDRIAELGARLQGDQELQVAIAGAPDLAEVVRIVTEAGYDLDPDDVVPATADPELTDAQLEAAVGAGFATYGCNTPTQYFVFTHCYP